MVRYLDGHVASKNQQSFRNRFINGFIRAISKKSTFPKTRLALRNRVSNFEGSIFDHNSKSLDGGLIKLTSKIERGKTVTVIYHNPTSLLKFIRIESFKNLLGAEYQYFLGID